MRCRDTGDADGGLQRSFESTDREQRDSAGLERAALPERGVGDRRQSDRPTSGSRHNQQDSARRADRRHLARRSVTTVAVVSTCTPTLLTGSATNAANTASNGRYCSMITRKLFIYLFANKSISNTRTFSFRQRNGQDNKAALTASIAAI